MYTIVLQKVTKNMDANSAEIWQHITEVGD